MILRLAHHGHQNRRLHTYFAFPEVFEEGLGTISEFEASIYLKDGAVPKSFPPQPVPHAFRGQVETELERLEREGIIRKVDHAEWASPTVIGRKKNGSIRLCADFKVSINPFIEPVSTLFQSQTLFPSGVEQHEQKVARHDNVRAHLQHTLSLYRSSRTLVVKGC